MSRRRFIAWAAIAGVMASPIAAQSALPKRVAVCLGPIPVERAREFGLAVNLRVARTLGIAVPGTLLLRANRVFE